MDTHTQQDKNNPINYQESAEDRQIVKDAQILDLLDELADKLIGDTPSEFMSKKEDLTDIDDVYNSLQDGGYFEEEIIYYSSAIRYLKENDPSLCDSLEIAEEYGYSCKNLNSEILASFHASREKENKFWEDIAPELEQLF